MNDKPNPINTKESADVVEKPALPALTNGSPLTETQTASLLPPTEFSKKLFLEITTRKTPIKHKQIQRVDLDGIIRACTEVANDLSKRGHVDANILFEISNGHEDYSGADKESFNSLFQSSSQVVSFSIGVAANYDEKRRPLANLKFTVGSAPLSSSQVSVSGTDEMWVKSTHALFAQLVDGLRGANGFLYHGLTEFLIQIFAVFVIFSLSVWSTKHVDPKALPFSTVYVFAAVFLFGSNTWSYLSRVLLEARVRYFPINAFKEQRIEGIILTLVLGLCLTILTWGINTSLDFVKGKIVNSEISGPQAPPDHKILDTEPSKQRPSSP